MDDTQDQGKGHSNEAAEPRTAEKSREHEGKLGQLVEQMKEKAAKATEKMRRVLTGKPLPR
jgi:hypothetical protein